MSEFYVEIKNINYKVESNYYDYIFVKSGLVAASSEIRTAKGDYLK